MSSVLYKQSVHHHKYLNLVIENNSATISPARGKVERGAEIIEAPSDHLLSIDRFFIKSCLLPVYSSIGSNMKFTLQYGSNLYSAEVIHTKLFYYSLHEVKEIMNTAIQTATNALNTGESTSLNAPVFDFAMNLWSLSSDSAFRNDVEVWFNYPAYLLMNTFEFETVNPAGVDLVGKLLLDDDVVEQRNQTLERWIPLLKIVVKSDLPIVDEFTPSRSSSLSYSDASESILTDYVIFATDSSAVVSIEFSASGNHRWISFDKSNSLQLFNLDFTWLDKNGNNYPLMLPPEDLIEMKLLFKEDSVTMEVPQ